MKTPWNSTRFTKFTTVWKYITSTVCYHNEEFLCYPYFTWNQNQAFLSLKKLPFWPPLVTVSNLAIGKFRHWNVNVAKSLKLWNCQFRHFLGYKIHEKWFHVKISMAEKLIMYHKPQQTINKWQTKSDFTKKSLESRK